MRGGALPPALLCAALGFALAFAPRRAWASSLLALIAAAATGYVLKPVGTWPDAVFLACWASVILIAASVHLPRGLPLWLALVMAVDAGAWAGAVTAVAGRPLDLAVALPFALLSLPAGWLVAHRRPIVIKVVASWLIAVSVLAAGLSMVPTPGYVPDHME